MNPAKKHIKISGMKIVTKIILSFLIILILSIATVGYLVNELKKSASILNDLYSTFIVTTNSQSAEININDYNINLNKLISSIKNKDEVAASALITSLISIDSTLNQYLVNIKKRIRDERGENLISQIEELNQKREIIESEIIESLNKKEFTAALEKSNNIKGDFDELIKILRYLNKFVKVLSDDSINTVQNSIDRGIMISIIISFILIAVFILLAIYLPRNISKSLSFFKEIFSKGASGDLQARYPVKTGVRNEINELGIFFNNFINKVRDVIKEVMDTSNELSSSSEELSATITVFSDNSQNQAASSEEITATMEEISAGIDNVSDNSQFQYNKLEEFISLMNDLSKIITSTATRISETQGLSRNIFEQAKAGNESLTSMDSIMKKITESSNKVSVIVDIIDNISDKINLLSLNAAIEAARAGEAGKGFAVVADEISKLADQTASSISDIDLLIRKNKEEISGGMKNVATTVENIGRVIEGVESINEMMNMIFSDMGKQEAANESANRSVDDLKIRSDEVRNASEEQKTAVSEVMKSITNINDIIQASAGGAEEMTANASKLASLAENMRDKVNFFQI